MLIVTQDPTSNPYGLGEGVKYYMLEVEDWTQPSHQNKRRLSSRKVSSDMESKVSPLASSTPALPPGPPEAEVEDTFLVTHPPNSHLFPVRTRANSSPTARPSSLSRLLAQAPTETQLDTIPASRTRTPSPTTSPPPPPSPSQHTGSAPHHAPGVPSPLRPGSRASRNSNMSRFSVGRIPPIGTMVSGSPGAAKAAPTTALVDQSLMASPSSSGEDYYFGGRPSTPSPNDSISDGMTNILKSRRRTSSYHVPRASPLTTSEPSTSSTITPATAAPSRPAMPNSSSTLANLASSWGVSFGRKKKAELEIAKLGTTLESPSPSGTSEHSTDPSASELLKRF